MTETSAAAKVLHTPELLETILLQLADSPKGWTNLLLSQRVSQTFKATVGSSPRLQETLHFRVSAETLDDNASNRYNKQVLSKIFEPACQIDDGRSHLQANTHYMYNVYMLPVHPATRDSHGVERSRVAKQLAGPDVDESTHMKPASWRRMVLRSTETRVWMGCSHMGPGYHCVPETSRDICCYCYGKSPFCKLDAADTEYHLVEIPGSIQDGETVEGLLRRLWPGRWL
ncbi:hypothetical protein LTR56_007033 [Elasticomyces elasticus]|nr:hypothetical protein LTR56_007033 [Elasticomyces elasticus]KAK3664098.1 hypothetical protein LTR22_005062 [Elasticomyces elasticus]KAK4927667.1 hypothetical protein LTR49_005536 [Elasticomyces elasticus]KAK5767038.1 hypothetical protein LTS12_002803 [Elasticomyces elasticus]